MPAGRRFIATVHDLALALMVGGIAGGAFSALVLFETAPTRQIAGQVGQAIFDRLGLIVLALALAALAARAALQRAAPPSRRAKASLWLAGAAAALAAVVALWLTPRMAEIWASAPHASDGSGLTGEDRRRFMRFHGVANLSYLSILLMGAAQIALRAFDRAGRG